MAQISGHLKFTRDSGHGHKDKFWVADVAKGTLSCYKNDSDAVAQFVIQAHQIQSVTEEVDRQNKFFDFRLRTAGKDGELFFRSQSQQDRDRWVKGINSLILNKRNSQLSKQFLQAIEGRCEDAAQKLSLGHGCVTYNGSLPLARVPNHLWQSYISAVEEAIRVAEGVVCHEGVAPYQARARHDGPQIIRAVHIYVVNGYQPSAPQTRHDHASSTLFIVITLLSAGRGVTYQHEDVATIVQLVYHSLEAGSAMHEPEELAARRAIVDYLTIPEEEEDGGSSAHSSRSFEIRYRFSDGSVPDKANGQVLGFTRAYLARHVTQRNMALLLENIRQVGSSPAAPITHGDGAEGDEAGGGAGPLSQEAQMLDSLTSLEILREMLAGVVVEIPFRQASIEYSSSGKERLLSQAPRLFAMRHHAEGKPEMTLVRTRVALQRYRGSLGLERQSREQTFVDQLQDIVLQVQVASQCSVVEERINGACGCREACVVDWGSLFAAVSRSLADLNADTAMRRGPALTITAENLPSVIRAVGDAYVGRIEAAVEILQQEMMPMSRADPTGAMASVYEWGYMRCVAGSTLSFKNGKPSTYIIRGLLGEVASIAVDAASGDEVQGLLRWTGDGSLPRIGLTFPQPLSDWLLGYFDEHGADDVAPQFDSQGRVLDEERMRQDEDQQLWERQKEAYLTQQEKVAIARSTENSALEMRDITRIVSDRQRQIHLSMGEGLDELLLASDATITLGVHALDRCFVKQGKHHSHILRLIDKQDTVKILSVSLLRLRLLFKHVKGSGASAEGGGSGSGRTTYDQYRHSTVALPEMMEVLRGFCDYTESEKRITVNMIDTMETIGSRYTFDAVARAALVNLLPEETRLSSLSRRDILVIGLENAGKTTIINHIRHQTGRETLATIGIAETFVAHNEWVFAFKELGGRVDFRKNWREYFKTLGNSMIHGLVVVVNAQDTKRFPEVKDFAREVATDKVCGRVPVLFVMNNHDEDDDADAQHQQQQLGWSSRDNTTSKGGRNKTPASPALTQQQQRPKRYTEEQIRKRLELERIAEGHVYKAVYCNITHMSSDKAIDHRLDGGLEWFCTELRKASPANGAPATPKFEGFKE